MFELDLSVALITRVVICWRCWRLLVGPAGEHGRDTPAPGAVIDSDGADALLC